MDENERVRRDVREMVISSGKVSLDEYGHITYDYMGTEYLVMVAVARISSNIKLGEDDE